jgi:hypothetical protein
VVLTSVKQSCVCWSQHDQSTTELYKKGVGTNPPSTPLNQQTNSLSVSASPPGLKVPVASDEADIQNCCFSSSPDRELNRSSVFGPHELARVLCTVISHAVGNYSAQEVREIHNLEHDKVYKFARVLRLGMSTDNKPNYHWGALTAKVGTQITSTKGDAQGFQRAAKNVTPLDVNDASAFYIIGVLSRGATSKVWHALDSCGNEVVIKMFVKSTDEKGALLEPANMNKKAKLATQVEAERLVRFYKNCLSTKKVYNVKLSGFHCVVMPLFRPIPKGERNNALPEVKKVLSNVFAKEKLKYRIDDVRWRHIGTYQGGTEKCYILYDLADLENTEGEGDLSFISSHISTLQSRMRTEDKVESQGFEAIVGNEPVKAIIVKEPMGKSS